ncbi:hypothetical protein E2C01_029417 [Portunus trituberculatus]|uniref:Uncharacterized protein n=1 Tax=Portunus trituberculatus TaxID=210409 RepID=A0A5B7ERU0_PORTR|nr:hypothetical protein [Portunus trituberculatus]
MREKRKERQGKVRQEEGNSEGKKEEEEKVKLRKAREGLARQGSGRQLVCASCIPPCCCLAIPDARTLHTLSHEQQEEQQQEEVDKKTSVLRNLGIWNVRKLGKLQKLMLGLE